MIIYFKYALLILFIFTWKFEYCQNKSTVKEGVYKIYDKKKLVGIESYKNNIADGLWTLYNKGGDSVNILYKNNVVYREKYWDNKGQPTLDVIYEYKKKDTLVSFTKWSEVFPFIIKEKSYYLNGVPVGYFSDKFDNGNKKSDGYYSKDSNNVIYDRLEYFSFIDDFFVNGVIIEDNMGDASVTKTLLKNEYYENGNIKKIIIPIQKDKLSGQIMYYSNEGKIIQISSIHYGKLDKEEVCAIIFKENKAKLIYDVEKELFCETKECWYLQGNSYFFNEEGLIVKQLVYDKGKEK